MNIDRDKSHVGEFEQLADIVQTLLEIEIKEVEENQRVYVSPDVYGKSLYHLIDKKYDGIQIEQVDIDEKWGKRVNLSFDELPVVLATLLKWYGEKLQAQQAAQSSFANDGFKDLDDHPF